MIFLWESKMIPTSGDEAWFRRYLRYFVAIIEPCGFFHMDKVSENSQYTENYPETADYVASSTQI